MSGVSKTIIIGNLGSDPETRATKEGKNVCSFSVATSESWKDKQTGQKQERTEWHRITAFEPLSDICQKYLVKGSKVYIEGQNRTRKWEKDGQTHYSTDIIARQMQMLDSKGGDQSQDQAARQAPKQQAAAPNGTGDDWDDDIPF